jgi:hypothetical protein
MTIVRIAFLKVRALRDMLEGIQEKDRLLVHLLDAIRALLNRLILELIKGSTQGSGPSIARFLNVTSNILAAQHFGSIT